MSVYEHWQSQKEALRKALDEQPDLAGVVYQVRHALLQTEQNAMAGIGDDVLRQQTGVLMSLLKTSVGLLEAQIATKVWVPQKQSERKQGRAQWPLWIIAFLLQLLLGGYCYWKGLLLGWIVALGALIVGVIALFAGRKRAPEPMQDDVRVTLRPDMDRLFGLLDGQMRAIDRAINDLSYLNEQLRGGPEGVSNQTLDRVADLMEALYGMDGDTAQTAAEVSGALLASLGLVAVQYSEKDRSLFNALPSKSETRTLSPAILSAQDRRLLKRGTAAVRTDAA